ncbi:MAG: DNA replication/repair protein RecF [Coriobacteriia bacterium]|nr:DNA replication/repair protein RecF [Coriobacteriia bacterium]
MSYTVETLELNGFRSYRKAKINFDPSLTILYGPNAAGKTNIIEALQLLTVGESFRKPLRQDLIYWECNQAHVKMRAVDKSLQRDVELRISEENKNIFVNEKRIRSFHDLSVALPCVIFTPDDLRIVKESSQRRRQEIDTLGTQLSSTYARLVSEYKKIIIQRNKLLKDNQYGTDIFLAWTERMIEAGVILAEKRSSLFSKLIDPMTHFYTRLLDENQKGQKIGLRYESSWGEECSYQSFSTALELRSEDERLRRQSLVGPHRDDLIFEINGKPARSFASQGQQRSIALAWKLAQLSVIEDITQSRPLLLLDDVMSELDQTRRHYLAGLVGDTAQTVITTAHIDYFDKDLIKRAKTIFIPDDVISSEGV